MALTTRDSVKIQAGIPLSDASRDAQFDALILAMTSLVKKTIRRDIEAADYTEYHSGDNSPILVLRQYPVISIDSVCVDSAGHFGQNADGFNSSLNLVEGRDFALKSGADGVGSSGILTRIGGVWYGVATRYAGWIANQPPKPTGNIKVVYRAGYEAADIPPDLVMAINSAVIMSAFSGSVGGVNAQSMSYEDASVSYADPGTVAKAFGSIKNVLSNYTSKAV